MSLWKQTYHHPQLRSVNTCMALHRTQENKKKQQKKPNTSCTHPAAAKPGTTSEGLDPKRRPLIEND